MQAMACAVLMESPCRNIMYILLAYFKMFVLCYVLIFTCRAYMFDKNKLTYLLTYLLTMFNITPCYNVKHFVYSV